MQEVHGTSRGSVDIWSKVAALANGTRRNTEKATATYTVN
jgi:hypothetical protein